MNQPEKKHKGGFRDSAADDLFIADGGGDTTVRPTDPRLREQIERYLRRLQTSPQQPPNEAPKPENGPPSA